MAEAKAEAPSAEVDPMAMFPVAAVVGMIYALVDANDSLIFAFLPGWFLDQGVSLSQSGGAFAANGVMMMLAALVVPKVMGGGANAAKTFFYAALCLCVALFFRGLLPFFSVFGPGALLSYYIVDNLFIGATWAFTEVAGLTWTMLSVPSKDRVGAMAALVNARSLGNLIGPALGGALFSLGGLIVAVMVGMLLLLLVTLMYKSQIFNSEYAPSGDIEKSAKGSIAKDAATAASLLILWVVFFAMLVYVPFLEPFFRDTFGVGEWVVGLVYSGAVIPFVIGAMLAAPLEKALGPLPTMIGGSVIAALGYLMLGPSPLFGVEPNLWLSLGGYFTIQVGVSWPLVVVTPLSMAKAQEAGFSEADATTQSSMLNVFTAASCLLVGPPAGGYLADNYGVGVAGTVMAAILVTFVPFLCMIIKMKSKAPQEGGAELM